ncbi:DUF1887 family CARF protein [Deltaproteobacteria bacterium TL4]
MATILVSLISDQTIPNLLLIKEFSPKIDRYLMVSTPKMEGRKVSQGIIKAAGISQELFETVNVEEDSLADIDSKLRDLNFDEADHFIVNLTGGTKIMSLGIYNFFLKRSSEIYYIPGGKNVYRKLFPEVKHKLFDIQYRVGVEEYLTCYGVEIKNSGENSMTQSAEYTQGFYEFYSHFKDAEFEILGKLRDVRERNKLPLAEIAGLDSFLQKIKFQPQQPILLTKNEIRYLTGDWFEEYIFAKLHNLIKPQDHEICKGLTIHRQQTDNEFDVMFTRDNTLYVIECKTSIYDGHSKKNVLTDALYKLAALKQDFGLFAQSFLFTLSQEGTKKNQVRELDKNRAKVLNVTVIDKTAIQLPSEELLKLMRITL